MSKKAIPLKEVSIEELFLGDGKSIYEIPIYQRNYAWEKDEINALVQDIYDAYIKDKNKPYYIGTLVSYHKGDDVYEIIDGQQRLTTIRLMLAALGIIPTHKLTYRARKKSDATINHLPKFDTEEKDSGIENGYRFVVSAIGDIVPDNDMNGFKSFFETGVRIIHYQVPKDIDLNHYFEIMNSRGEQLEKHEIVKAKLMQELGSDEERKVFNSIWECCSEMSIYAQQNLTAFITETVFGDSLYEFIPDSFDKLLELYRNYSKIKSTDNSGESFTIARIIAEEGKGNWIYLDEEDKKDSFQPIIDFPNFLLIALKLTRMDEPCFSPIEFNLDDKELLNEFDKARFDKEKTKKFVFNLLKARFLLDNYIVHHSKEEDTLDSNPWKLQVWHKDAASKKSMLKNLCDNTSLQNRLVHLLSMFEVSFTARQRKNYLFYCLLHLMKDENRNITSYLGFVENLANKFFNTVYLDMTKLNAKNTPIPGSFDEVLLKDNKISISNYLHRGKKEFIEIFGDGSKASVGVPLFVFNYLDYRLWKKYDAELRGEKQKEGSRERQSFFDSLGCGDFGLKIFDQFYFSRTRRSLEHFYPQANATGKDGALDQDQINCIGNYAMIGNDANSSGSNWSPMTKLNHYLDASGKISQISVASLKFMIMMQMCKDNHSWDYETIKKHQDKMITILVGE